MIIRIKDGKITEIEQNRQVNDDLDNVELGGTLDISSEAAGGTAMSAEQSVHQPEAAVQPDTTEQTAEAASVQTVKVPAYDGYHPQTSGNDQGSA